jgi:hypothetical protein
LHRFINEKRKEKKKKGCSREKKGKRDERKENSMRSQMERWHAYEKGATTAKFPPQFNYVIDL